MKSEIICKCNTCKDNTKHTIKHELKKDSTSILDEKPFGENSGDFSSFYQIIECQICETISFREALEIYIAPLDENDEPVGFTSISAEKIFPDRFLRQQKIYRLLPKNIRENYEQTVALYNQTQKKPCVIMLRALAEMGCNIMLENANLPRPPRSELLLKINILHENNKISVDDVELLHKIRIAGNEANHNDCILPEKTLSDYLDGVEKIVEKVFEFNL